PRLFMKSSPITRPLMKSIRLICVCALWLGRAAIGAEDAAWARIEPYFSPPPEYAHQFGAYSSQLRFYDGTPVKDAQDWQKRRQEILARWHQLMGPWPPLLAKPRVEMISQEKRENFTQHKIKVEIAENFMSDGYLLVPEG